MDNSLSIYIIGAQCTGKTTLVEAVAQRLQSNEAKLSFSTIKELARGILKTASVNRNDIRAGTEKAMEFQRLVLSAQVNEELDRESHGFIVSDRSGVDPIAYARLYGPPEAAKKLLESFDWGLLRERMRQGLVILCEPVPEWLFDDGTRLMPADDEEWHKLHQVFIGLLREAGVAFEVLPATCTSKEERTEFVLDRWGNKWRSLDPVGGGGRSWREWTRCLDEQRRAKQDYGETHFW